MISRFKIFASKVVGDPLGPMRHAGLGRIRAGSDIGEKVRGIGRAGSWQPTVRSAPRAFRARQLEPSPAPWPTPRLFLARQTRARQSKRSRRRLAIVHAVVAAQ